jgi:hypothetical protein
VTFEPPITDPKSAAVSGWVEYITFPSVRIIVGLFCRFGIADKFVGTVDEAAGRPAPSCAPLVKTLYGEEGDRSLPCPRLMLDELRGRDGVPDASLNGFEAIPGLESRV